MQRAHLRPTGTSRHMHARSRDGRTIIKFVLRQESLELSWRDYLCAKLSRTGTSVHAADRIHSTSANGRDELLAGSQRRCAEQSHSHRRVCTQFVSAARTRARENECCDIVSVIGREREDKSACEEVPRKICTCARLMCWKLWIATEIRERKRIETRVEEFKDITDSNFPLAGWVRRKCTLVHASNFPWTPRMLRWLCIFRKNYLPRISR